MIPRRLFLEGSIGALIVMSFGEKTAQGFGNTDVLVAEEVILIGNNKKFLLAYNPSPGPNKLVASISPVQVATPDSYGNSILGGFASYEFDALNNQYLASQFNTTSTDYYTAPTEAGPWTLTASVSTFDTNSGNYYIIPKANGFVQVTGAFQVTALSSLNGGAYIPPLTSAIGTATNTVAETVIGTIDIPANDAQSFTSCYEWRIAGNINAAAAMNVTLRMRIGGLAGTVLGTYGPFTVRALIVGMAFGASGRILCRSNGSGGHFDGWSELSEQIAQVNSLIHGDQTQFIAQDTTVPYTLVLTAQMSIANAGNQAQTQEVDCQRFSH